MAVAESELDVQLRAQRLQRLRRLRADLWDEVAATHSRRQGGAVLADAIRQCPDWLADMELWRVLGVGNRLDDEKRGTIIRRQSVAGSTLLGGFSRAERGRSAAAVRGVTQ
jgi:hypothetical protein